MAVAYRFEGNGRFLKFYATAVAASKAFPVAMPAAAGDDLGDPSLTTDGGDGIQWPAVIDVEGVQEIAVHVYWSIATATGQGSYLAYWHTPVTQNTLPSRNRTDWIADAASVNGANLASALASGAWLQEYHKKYLRNAGEIKGRYFYPSAAIATAAANIMVVVELKY